MADLNENPAPESSVSEASEAPEPAEKAPRAEAVPEGAAAPSAGEAPEKPKRRTRARKATEPTPEGADRAADAAPAQAVPAQDAGEPAAEKPKRRAQGVGEPASESSERGIQDAGEPAAEKPKRRTRTRKAAERPAEPGADASADDAGAAASPAAEEPQGAPEGSAAPAAPEQAPRRRTRRTAKSQASQAAPDAPQADGPKGAGEPSGTEAQKASSLPREEGESGRHRDGKADRPEKGDKPDRPEKGDKPDRAAQSEKIAKSERSDRPDKGEKADRTDRPDRSEKPDDVRPQGRQRRDQNQSRQQGQDTARGARNERPGRNNRNNRNERSNRHNKKSQPSAPSLTREELEGLKVAELRSKAAELGIPFIGLRKAELVEAVYDAAARAEGFRPVCGILEVTGENFGFLRTDNYMQGEDDAFVQQAVIRQYGLRRGDLVCGTVRPAAPGNKFPPLAQVSSVNGLPPEQAKLRPRFRDLTPIYPNERLVMECGQSSITGRVIDLVSPIGKGQRGLIVSPPKAGKTTVLKNICQSIAHNNPEVHLICLLVDERPEEVTDMQRSIKGDVVASTFDMPADNHTKVAELVIERAKRLVEQGEDVVVVLDSITRLARAYNLAAPASGRILSGGVDSAALYPPKRFLGAARNIENGGSLTILASALVDTGSKMDEVIFEEFKGTGNMELKLDRDLADKRVFPAVDPVASGTRNEDLLISPQMAPFVWGLRRVLANMNNPERAEISLVKGLKQTRTNEEFLIRSAKKAAQTDYVD